MLNILEEIQTNTPTVDINKTNKQGNHEIVCKIYLKDQDKPIDCYKIDEVSRTDNTVTVTIGIKNGTMLSQSQDGDTVIIKTSINIKEIVKTTYVMDGKSNFLPFSPNSSLY